MKDKKPCKRCEGTGQIYLRTYGHSDDYMIGGHVSCPDCHGSGKE